MMKVERWDPASDGPLTETALRAKLEREGFTVHRYDYPPGTYFPDHTHGVDKKDAVLAGRFRLTVEGESAVLQQGDVAFVPRGAVHSAEVVGDETVVSLDATRPATA